MISYPAEYTKNGDGYFLQFIVFPSAATEGKTKEEMMENARDVLSLVIGSRIDDNKDIPEPSKIKCPINVIYVKPYPDVALPIEFRRIRRRLDLTQTDVALRMKVKFQQYQKLESARKFNPTIKTLKKVAKALGKEIVIELADKKPV